ncbi:two component transcriptional regulator, LuxR family [Rhodoferax ferrireducens T118]|uniref:Two component transcriptional regulator, LuxR family n=1 Tax=Albidiferax ferrireducens (strain ATCC BAA-621 / DSM 15236 / T118) TaxID=338969 RepID=Q21SZ7_ALBFT|nr:response regulator transcription factor [Rhodoferax ferrireducens]ABD71106.1 two component transcriptional regulator, LuxR family [Rhodoferax ferrireducens T118]
MKTSAPKPSLDQTLDRANSDLVLIVDDVPDNLSVLHDALDESGYTVLVATHGEAALQRAAQALPDIVLLDAMMPGMDGFEVARRLKAAPQTAHIPIIFMTGLLDTEYLVAALEAGGVDYVTKPIKPKEVLARMQVHLQGAREKRQARSALDAFGYASITVRVSDGKLMWQTPLARELLLRYYGTEAPKTPEPVCQWLRRHVNDAVALTEPPRLSIELGPKRLTFRLHQQIGDSEGGGDWLIIMQEVSDESVIEAIALSFKLTPREAEVLYWVVKGKINRDIGDILGSSPMTVKKHLEHVFAKLGVETRTAAAGMAMSRIRQLHPQFEG